jgi:hypothetical protein
MPTFYVDNIDIEPGDFLDSCSESEIEKLIEYLTEDGRINSSVVLLSENNLSATDDIFEEHLNVLHGKKHMLTNEEEETIIRIASKFRYL